MKKVTNTHSPTQNTTKIYWNSFFVVPLVIFLMVITQCEDPQQEEEPWPWYLKRVTYTVTFVDAFTGEPLANRDVCVGRSFQAVFGIECDTLKKTDDQGQLSGVMLMEVGHAIGFTLPYVGILNGIDRSVREGQDAYRDYQRSGVESYNLNQEFKIRFHEIGAVNDNSQIDWNYNICFNVTPNGYVYLEIPWLPENFGLKLKPRGYDTLLTGPMNGGPYSPNNGLEIYLPPNQLTEFELFLSPLPDLDALIHFGDTTFYVLKDSIPNFGEKMHKGGYLLTINKPKDLEYEKLRE